MRFITQQCDRYTETGLPDKLAFGKEKALYVLRIGYIRTVRSADLQRQAQGLVECGVERVHVANVLSV